MANWIEYEGTDEQIVEIKNCEHGYVKRFADGMESLLLSGDNFPSFMGTPTHYLIAQPHPLADMIIRQAQTGQPVWIRTYHRGTCHQEWTDHEPTVTPDWNIGEYAEYSFTPFEEHYDGRCCHSFENVQFKE